MKIEVINQPVQKRIKTKLLVPEKTWKNKHKAATEAVRWNVRDAQHFIYEHQAELFDRDGRTYVINFLYDRGYKSGNAFKFTGHDSIRFYNPNVEYANSNEAKNHDNEDIYAVTITQY